MRCFRRLEGITRVHRITNDTVKHKIRDLLGEYDPLSGSCTWEKYRRLGSLALDVVDVRKQPGRPSRLADIAQWTGIVITTCMTKDSTNMLRIWSAYLDLSVHVPPGVLDITVFVDVCSFGFFFVVLPLIHVINLLKSDCLCVTIRKRQATVVARSSRDISQTVRIDCHSCRCECIRHIYDQYCYYDNIDEMLTISTLIHVDASVYVI